MKLSLAISSCPNDTFIFDALVNKRIDTEGLDFEPWLGDIMHLNKKAMASQPDIVKVSYNTYGRILGDYHLLRAGGAAGYNCGPLLIARPGTGIRELIEKQGTIAIPGQYTTANLLLNFFAPGLRKREDMIFHQIMPAVSNCVMAAGVIIHENRFTYKEHGLICIRDLGEFWESKTGLPIPLGAIVAKKSLGDELISQIDRLVRKSVEYAFAHPKDSALFVSQHAQEMEPDVMQQHIDLYVNDFSIDMGPKGVNAVKRLLEEGIRMGLYPQTVLEEFESQVNKGRERQ